MPASVYVDTNKRKSGTAGATQRWASLRKEEEEVTVMKMFLCVFTCLHCVLCKVKTKRASHNFNKCFIGHGTWKIPGKIRFIWPSERRAQGTGSVKVSIMVFTQLVFISVPHCKNIRDRNPPSILLPIQYTHIFRYWGGGESPTWGDCHCDWYFLQWAPSVLLLFPLSLSGRLLWAVRANYYGNEWNGYQMGFFSFVFHPYSCTHTHICSCLHLLVSVDCLIFMGSLSAAHSHTHSEKQYSWKFRIFDWERAVFVVASETVRWEVRLRLFLRPSLCLPVKDWFMWRWLCSSRHPIMCFIKCVRNAQGGRKVRSQVYFRTVRICGPPHIPIIFPIFHFPIPFRADQRLCLFRKKKNPWIIGIWYPFKWGFVFWFDLLFILLCLWGKSF